MAAGLGSRRKLWLLLSLVLVLAMAAYFGVERYRYRFIRSNDDLLRLLPAGDTTSFFADVAKLRQGGYLRLLAGAQPKHDADYLTFLRQTGFDYSTDIDALAGASEGQQLWFALRGTFDWRKLAHYATQQGGTCHSSICSVPTSTPGRWASFRSLQPDVMVLAVSTRPAAAGRFGLAPAPATTPSNAPVWVHPSHALLTNPADLPLALRIFAISLQSADSVLLSLRPASTPDSAFVVETDAVFSNQSAAETARHQLDISTGLLKLELKRENQAPRPSDLTGLLTSGVFQLVHHHLIGTWPVPKQLLQSLQ